MSAALVAADVLEEQGHWPLGAACAGYVPADGPHPDTYEGDGAGYGAEAGSSCADGVSMQFGVVVENGDGVSGWVDAGMGMGSDGDDSGDGWSAATSVNPLLW